MDTYRGLITGLRTLPLPSPPREVIIERYTPVLTAGEPPSPILTLQVIKSCVTVMISGGYPFEQIRVITKIAEGHFIETLIGDIAPAQASCLPLQPVQGVYVRK